MTEPDHAPCWHVRVLPHPPPKHGPHTHHTTIALSDVPAPKVAVCCWCGATTPYKNIMTPLPTDHPR